MRTTDVQMLRMPRLSDPGPSDPEPIEPLPDIPDSPGPPGTDVPAQPQAGLMAAGSIA